MTAALANADAREQLARVASADRGGGDAERRRLERDLHDGAQQEFVAPRSASKLVRDEWSTPDRGARAARGALERVQAGLATSASSRRASTRASSAIAGSGAALESLASRSAVPVELAPLPPGRLPASVETTAYFVVAEALTNAAKHAQCERAEVAVRLENGSAVITVADDGVGGADATAGSGLRGSRIASARSAAGSTIDSPPGAGTAITARIAVPFGSIAGGRTA